MSQFVVMLVSGLSLGAIFALISLGLVLVFRATHVFNFAHGQFMVLGAFIAAKWQADETGSYGVGLAVAVVVVGLIATAFYALILQRMVGRPLFLAVVATLGFAAVLDGVMNLVYGRSGYTLEIPAIPTGVSTIFGARLSQETLVLTALSFALALTVAGVLRYTELGTRVRAAGQDPILASQRGIRVRWIYFGSWFLAGALAAIAGISYGSTNVVGTPLIELALLAFPALLLGGLDSIEGAIVGGIAVGLLQSVVAVYWDSSAVNVVTYAGLLVVLLLRPSGLFGTVQVSRA